MRVLFLFLDGVGLGPADPDTNPLARARMPFLEEALGGRKLTLDVAPYVGEHASLIALDATLGVPGYPQSATGQAVLLTGINIPAQLGYHYGPKPNTEVARFLDQDSIFARLLARGKLCALLNAYPPRYFDGIESGLRLYSSIPWAVTKAGLPLFTKEDYLARRALAADFTGQGWKTFLGIADAPLYTPEESGRELARLAAGFDFSLFEYWASDYAGHKQDMASGVEQLEILDSVLAGLLSEWAEDRDLILITSDHGNLEDLSVRRHTLNPVPAIVFGPREARSSFCNGLTDLAGIAPAIYDAVTRS
jgi:2,3-bisphosphoglycerate-independent phosphoglycerate mutase